MKSELAYQLASENAALRNELAETIGAIHNAAKEIRNVTRVRPPVSLTEEAARAQDVLRMFGTDCEVRVAEAEPSPAVGAVLGTAIREGVTNVLRHSRATHCRIESTAVDGWIRLSISNDGIPKGARGVSVAGNGLINLGRRAAARGGRVGAAVDEHGWFRLTVELPDDTAE